MAEVWGKNRRGNKTRSGKRQRAEQNLEVDDDETR